MASQAMLREIFQYGTLAHEPILTPPETKQIQVYESRIINGSGSAANLGLFRKLADVNDKWRAWKKPVGSLTEITTELQGSGTVDVFESDNDYLLFASKKRFGLVGLIGSIASTGGTPAYTIQFWNGSAWATLNTIDVISGQVGVGINLVSVFNPPYNWETGNDVSLDSTLYYVKIISTTAPTGTAGTISSGYMGQMLTYDEAISDNGSIKLTSIDDKLPLRLEAGQGLIPYFSAAANDNRIEVSYKVGQ